MTAFLGTNDPLVACSQRVVADTLGGDEGAASAIEGEARARFARYLGALPPADPNIELLYGRLVATANRALEVKGCIDVQGRRPGNTVSIDWQRPYWEVFATYEIRVSTSRSATVDTADVISYTKGYSNGRHTARFNNGAEYLKVFITPIVEWGRALTTCLEFEKEVCRLAPDRLLIFLIATLLAPNRVLENLVRVIITPDRVLRRRPISAVLTPDRLFVNLPPRRLAPERPPRPNLPAVNVLDRLLELIQPIRC